MDSYVGAGTTGWTDDNKRQGTLILEQLRSVLQQVYGCNMGKISNTDGFVQCRIQRPGRVGWLLFTAEVFYCAERKTYALQLGFGNHWYNENPVWICLPSTHILAPQAVQNAWKRCEKNIS